MKKNKSKGIQVLVRDIETSSYPGFELSRFNCIVHQ